MFQIAAYDHIGIRVTDLPRALAFYGLLGFELEPGEAWEEHRAVGLINEAGLRLNLIYNGKPRDETANILMDEPEKWPGFTHLALLIDDLDEVMRLLAEHGIALTEGPMALGEQRRICFIRDPDGNVIEFTERWAGAASGDTRAS
jgi:catechol 2,3-dioxygenase-like lactoylglutathione lyase family enzyme